MFYGRNDWGVVIIDEWLDIYKWSTSHNPKRQI